MRPETAAPPRAVTKPFLRTLEGHTAARPPLWLMRQAGRYLPEYREIRATAPAFLDFCYDPRLATEATLQPLRRFGFDAAILFSDILVIPDALGQTVTFEAGEGPRLTPIATAADVAALHDTLDMERLGPVFETVERVKAALDEDIAFIGFCGAPWTVASYMIAGRGTPDQAPARLFAYRDPALFHTIIDRLVAVSIQYLVRQIDCGVEVVQIFDSWAGVLPRADFERWSLAPVSAIIAGVRDARPNAKAIAFFRGASPRIATAGAACGADAIGLDTAIDARWAATAIALPTQGNLDPLALVAGGPALEAAIDEILAAFAGRPHIFNLGHGILQETPISHVETLVRRVRAAS